MNKKALIGLIVFLGYPFLLQLLHLDLIMGEVGFWLLLVFIILWIYLVEKRTLASIGWQKVTVKTILGGLGLGLFLFILFGILTTAIQAIGLELNQEMAEMMASQPIPVLILIALRAGVVEEVLYRGYAFERLYEVTGSKWIAGLVPLIIFVLVHLAWGVGHLVFVFFAGALFMLLYITKRNLPLVIIAHFTVDVIALLVLPLMLAS
jgi:membrane protease YdiL (CAAX protease family)